MKTLVAFVACAALAIILLSVITRNGEKHAEEPAEAIIAYEKSHRETLPGELNPVAPTRESALPLKKEGGTIPSFVPLPEKLRAPEIVQEIRRYLEIEARAAAHQPLLTPPTNALPAFSVTSEETGERVDVSDEEIAAFEEAVAESEPAYLAWRSNIVAKLPEIAGSMKELAAARDRLKTFLGEGGFNDVLAWKKANRIAGLLASTSLSDEQIRETAVLLAQMWAKGETLQSVEPQLEALIGKEYRFLRRALAQRMSGP